MPRRCLFVLATLFVLVLATAPAAGAAQPAQASGKKADKQTGPPPKADSGTTGGGAGGGSNLGLGSGGKLANTAGDSSAPSAGWIGLLAGVGCLGGASLVLLTGARRTRAGKERAARFGTRAGGA